MVKHLKETLTSGKPIADKELINESGDVLWYLALMFNKLSVTFEQVAKGNIKKLQTRYPSQFLRQARAIELLEMILTIKNGN